LEVTDVSSDGPLGAELLEGMKQGILEGLGVEGSVLAVEGLERFGFLFGGGDVPAEMLGEGLEDLGEAEAWGSQG